MEQIIIKHKDGTTLPLMRRGAVSAVTSAKQKKAFAGADTVTLTVESALPLDFQIGDKIVAFSGETYTLNALAPVKKVGPRRFEYTLTMEGRQYELIDAQWLLPDGLMLDSYTGTLAQFAAILINNANRRQPGRWVLGTVPAESDYKTLTYSGKNCLEVLWDLCSQYGVESEIIEDAQQGTLTLHFRTVGQVFPFTFKYGRAGGLYNLERKAVSGTNVITRLYVYGGNKNLPSGYRYNRLCLPAKQKNESYIEDADAVARYGIREGRKEYNDIFPQRYGEVTALGGDVLSFVDNTMDFDLNERDQEGNTKWLRDGMPAKVQFTTGQLAGYSFELQSYNHSTKTIRIKAFQDSSGYTFPDAASAARQFAVGDKYFFTEIQLPQSYVDAAESATQTAGTADYNKTKAPQASYSLELEKLFLEQFAGGGTEAALFQPGDYLTVQDDDLGVERSIRIKELTRDLLDPYKYSVTLSDTAAKASSLVRTIADVQDLKEIIEINQLNDPQKARRNWRATQDVLSAVFDPEGHYYSEKIRPLSIETTMLAVEAKSQQFTLAGITFEPNYNGDANAIASSSGVLVHFAIEDSIRTWALAAVSVSNLTPGTIYYVYARCSRTGTAGNIVIDATQRRADSDTTYYYFLIGTLSSVITDSGGTRGARVLSLTYGSSTINGRFITTGRIQSSGGSPTYFDLDNGEIGGKIKFTATDGTSKNVADLDDIANDAKDYIDNTLPGILADIQAQLDGQIEQFFETYDPTTSNLPASGWSAQDKENHLGDLFYNTANGKVFRWVKENGVYKWQELSDAEVAQALQLANDALALALEKRRIFTTTPTTPYDVGDLWVQGPNGGIYRCKTARASGNYNSADWEVASNYTDDTALNNFIAGQFATVTADLTTQIDGKIETWFTDSDPATAWTTAALKAKHVGDMWYSATAKLLKRYCVSGSTYSWETVEDKKALDAYEAASNAQDTADGKRRVFVAQPTTPYDVGDLWLKTESNGNKVIYRCFTARASGSYIASDWDEAVTYDNTKTVIDGGLVTSGTVQLAGDDSHIKAGITGEGTAETSVRIWAGATRANKASAPFRVLQSGKLYATDAEISGTIHASAGDIVDVVTKRLRNPFRQVTSSFDAIDDDTVYSSNLNTHLVGTLDWTSKSSGRRMVLAGSFNITAPTGKYFYENGRKYTNLLTSFEVTELLGWGTTSGFSGWIILNRSLFQTNRSFGRTITPLCFGRVNGYSSGASFAIKKVFDGSALTCGRTGTGNYYIHVPRTWFVDASYILPILVGYGPVAGSTSAWCKATLLSIEESTYTVDGTSRQSYKLNIGVSDDDSANDGSFYFLLYNMAQWDD